MRNLIIYLTLLLCLFTSKIFAQDPSQNDEQAKQAYEEACEKYDIKHKQIIEEEGEIFNEELDKLKVQRKKGIISTQEFKERKDVLENKKTANIKERDKLNSDNFYQQFPEMGANSFEGRAFWISFGIKKDVREEKELLKNEIEAIDMKLIEGSITKKQAEEQKQKLAKIRAKSIEEKVKLKQEALNKLIQDDVDGNLKVHEKHPLSLTLSGNNDTKTNIDNQNNFALPAMKNYEGQRDKDRQQSKRTTSQFVFAFGANNLVTGGAVANSDFRYWQSRFYEWGFTFNSRIISDHNLLHAKYGLSLMYNDLKPIDNRFFFDNGSQTDLETNPIHQDHSRFRNVNLVVPLHLEFDFTKPTVKNGKTYFKSHNSFRLGIGGYLGANVKSKQILKYDIDGYYTAEKIKGDYNTNGFIYGLSTYIGYGSTSLYFKYDLNPLFKDNVVKQNNVSLGIRFDFN